MRGVETTKMKETILVRKWTFTGTGKERVRGSDTAELKTTGTLMSNL